jgi:acyl-CoA thioester hydrolase
MSTATNNVVYYAYFDTAVNGWLIDATGTDIRALPAIDRGRDRVPVPGAAQLPDPVTAGLRLGRLGTSSVVRDRAVPRRRREPAGLATARLRRPRHPTAGTGTQIRAALAVSP